MCTYLEHDALITVDQSAYRKRHNTQTALHKVLDGSSPMGYWRPSALLTLRNVSTQLTILFKKMGIYGLSSDTTDSNSCLVIMNYPANINSILVSLRGLSKERFYIYYMLMVLTYMLT